MALKVKWVNFIILDRMFTFFPTFFFAGRKTASKESFILGNWHLLTVNKFRITEKRKFIVFSIWQKLVVGSHIVRRCGQVELCGMGSIERATNRAWAAITNAFKDVVSGIYFLFQDNSVYWNVEMIYILIFWNRRFETKDSSQIKFSFLLFRFGKKTNSSCLFEVITFYPLYNLNMFLAEPELLYCCNDDYCNGSTTFGQNLGLMLSLLLLTIGFNL